MALDAGIVLEPDQYEYAATKFLHLYLDLLCVP